MNLNEILVIIIVAFAVLRPQRLPEVARMLGAAVSKFQKISKDVQTAINEQVQLDQLKENEKKAKLADQIYNDKK